MTNSFTLHVTTQELCEQINLTTDTLIDIIEHGIVAPQGQTPEDWLFNAELVCITHRAARLHRDLGLNWSGVALVLELLEQREALQAENAMLQQRLARFELLE